ncbi:MAG: fibronectin type III domain-containing protein, partial [Clostridia bacterium]|nr:fibronectin type III domain-containing protein [Clostridia bacterium]
LKLGTDYTISYSNNINAGTAIVTITGIGNFTGIKYITFNIFPKSISTVSVSSINNQTYTGRAIKPNITIKSENKILKLGTDYAVSYSNNKNTGKATLIITGIGNYTGTLSKIFYIVPKKVTGVKAKSQTTSSVTLSWSKATGASRYQIQRYNSSKKTWVNVTTTNKTSYKVSKLSNGTTYKFRVRAYKTVSETNKYGNWSSTLNTATKTVTPKISKITAKNKKATIKWKKIHGSTGYEIYMSTRKKGTYKKVTTIKKASTVSYTKSNLIKGKTYYFKIRAYKTVNNKKIYSSYSAVKSIKIKK